MAPSTGLLSPSLRTLLARCAFILLVPLLALSICAIAAVHPRLTRQQAIQAVVGKANHLSRVETKYMHRSDFENTVGGGYRGPDSNVWVIAISGDWGPRGENSIKPNTASLVVIDDQPGPVRMDALLGYKTEGWPPPFDQLPDLSNGA